MLLASTALSLANYSSKVSNNNICSTQAEITAQNYLQEYINSFAGNYDDLASLAGTSESSPSIVNVSMQDSAGNTISDAGTCQIKIYKSGSGVVVKSEATYAGETEVASAFFDGTVSNPYESNNAIEVSDAYNMNGVASPIDGDICIDYPAVDKVISFHNSNGNYNSNVYSWNAIQIGEGSTAIHFKDARYCDSTDMAPTIMCLSYISIYNLDMTSVVGKKDTSQKRLKTDLGDKNNLSNIDGYILSDKKVWFNCIASSSAIGEADSPIDVFAHGIYVGNIPEKLYTPTTQVDIGDRETLKDLYGSYGGANTPPTINGNVCSYAGVAQDRTSQNGDVVINCGSQTFEVNGDFVVGGDLYLCNDSRLKVTGNLYVNGKIYISGSNSANSTEAEIISATGSDDGSIDVLNGQTIQSGKITVGKKMYKSLPTGKRYVMPAMDFDPSNGKTRTTTSYYQDATPNDMYVSSIYGTNEEKTAAKNIAEKYEEALGTYLFNTYYNTKTSSWENVSNYTEKQASRTDKIDANIEIYSSCSLLPSQVQYSSYNYTIKLKDKDIVILLPATSAEVKNCSYKIPMNMWYTDEGSSSKTEYSYNASIMSKFKIDISDRGTNDTFVYFMMYDPTDLSVNFYYETDVAAGQSSTRTFLKSYNPSESIASVYEDLFNIELNGEKPQMPDFTSSSQTMSYSYTNPTGNETSESWSSISYSSLPKYVKDICNKWGYDSYIVESATYSSKKSYFINFAADGGGLKLFDTSFCSEFSASYYDAYNTLRNDSAASCKSFVLSPDNSSITIPGNNSVYQTIFYGPKSDFEMTGSNSLVFGQIKTKTFTAPQNSDKVAFNIKPASNSILEFIQIKNPTVATLKLEYFTKYKS